ncbi:hypothetical protein DD584_32670 [Klebsiella pneumoniae]|nr:hypothetical protein DD584_32670 [Klebsiella pneumoniae]
MGIGGVIWLEVGDCEQRECFHRRHIMYLQWLLVSDCEQRGCIHLLHIMSQRWLRVSDCEQAEVGYVSTHRESAGGGGIRLRATWGHPRLHVEGVVGGRGSRGEQGG